MIDLMSYNFTIKKAGKVFTLKRYKKTRYFNYQEKPMIKTSKGKGDNLKENFIKSTVRARQNVFDIISCNIGNVPDYQGSMQYPKFLTLTFKENITDTSEANLEFTNFNKRLSYYLYKTKRNVLKYICIPEFQKRGAIHFHVLYFNMPFVNFEEIASIWGNGFIFIESVKDNIEDYAKYVAKYINKENFKGEDNYELYLFKSMLNKKRYFCSRGLNRPTTFKLDIDNDIYEMIISYLKDFHTDNYIYYNEYIGFVEENNYKISNKKVIKILFATIDNIVKEMFKIYNKPIKLNFNQIKEYKNLLFNTYEVSPWQI